MNADAFRNKLFTQTPLQIMRTPCGNDKALVPMGTTPRKKKKQQKTPTATPHNLQKTMQKT